VANTWQQVTIPLAALAAVAAPTFTGFWDPGVGRAHPSRPTYVDDVVHDPLGADHPPPPLDHGMALYGDRFSEGWDNWSWATVDAGTRAR